VRFSNERVIAASFLDDVTNQVLLTVVRGQDRYVRSRVSQQTHVHKQCHTVFSLCQILQTRERFKESSLHWNNFFLYFFWIIPLKLTFSEKTKHFKMEKKKKILVKIICISYAKIKKEILEI